MSAGKREVAVTLQAGKKYVLRNGRHVIVTGNPHWQCAAKFPFFVMQGPDFVVYFTPEGQADPDGGTNEYDILRPIYEPGEVYVSRDGQRHKITRHDDGTVYPLVSDDLTWTRDGRCVGTADSDYDLMDFAPLAAPAPARNLAAVAGVGPKVQTIAHDVVPDLPILATPITPSRVGMRVEVRLAHATTGLGVIKYEDPDGTCVVEFDDGAEGLRLHDCDGHAPSGRGWWCHNDTIRVLSETETRVEAGRNETEALNEVDVAEVWAAYRINPSISIDAWIDARLVLKAAAK